MDLSILAPVGAVVALLFAFFLSRRVMKADEGTDLMKKIAGAVRKGANAYLKRQYTGVAIFFAVMFVILLILAIAGFLTPFVPVAFLTGGFFSALSGFIGMKIATYANGRTANSASKSLNAGLRIAFSAGGVMGFVVVGLGLLDISIWYFFLKFWYSTVDVMQNEAAQVQAITSAMLTFGMGASSMALFARVGGGIFTKADAVGADLVGKVEAGIPEDDPRNPAVLADNVGDNVGDVAGMGADLFDSNVAAMAATIVIAAAIGQVAFMFAITSMGLLASIAGVFLPRLGPKGSPARALKGGTYVACGIFAVLTGIAVAISKCDCRLWGCAMLGMVAGVVIMDMTGTMSYDPRLILVVAACVLVYAGMFSNFGLYFSFISEAGIPVELGGVAIGMASTFGYLPEVLSYTIAGKLLDTYPGYQG